jgi:3-hydroxyisobutyrate dehydrogenase-like beta-hydroxyacid dehydrogenase
MVPKFKITTSYLSKTWRRIRTVAKSEKLLQELGPSKIKIANSAADLARECDVIFTNLANDEVVKSVYEEFLNVLKVMR